MNKYLLLNFIACVFTISSIAQSTFVIGNININGNRRTKSYIITRELPFRSGDTIDISTLVKKFEVARQQLINTKLFNEAIVAVQAFNGYSVDVSIDVKERWYLFPLPYLKPGDRNLSEWAKHDYAFNRLNYGAKFTQYNFSGRNDKLRLWLVTGFSKQIQLQYDQPYVDKHLKSGFKVGFGFSSTKNFNYATINNQQQFIDTLSPIKRWSGFVEYDYRPGLRTFHAFRIGYTKLKGDLKLNSLNPEYFRDSSANIHIPEISYTIDHYHVDYIPYPLKGWMAQFSVSKKGFSGNSSMWQIGSRYTAAVPLKEKLNFHWQAQGAIRSPPEQPYYNTQMLGYGDLYLRGLENYVIDGTAVILSRQTMRRELASFLVPTYSGAPTLDVIPVKIYAKAFGDFGYAYNKTVPRNSLANHMLYTAGVGIDIVTFYDLVFRVDYSFNQLGQNGLFLHFRNEF